MVSYISQECLCTLQMCADLKPAPQAESPGQVNCPFQQDWRCVSVYYLYSALDVASCQDYLSHCYSSMGPRNANPLAHQGQMIRGAQSVCLGCLILLALERHLECMGVGHAPWLQHDIRKNPCLCAPANFSKGVGECHDFTLAGTSQGVRECHTHSSLPVLPRQWESALSAYLPVLTRQESVKWHLPAFQSPERAPTVLTSPSRCLKISV